MTRKLQQCGECMEAHQPKGGKKCTYVILAKRACTAATGEEKDWKLYIDPEIIKEDSDKYIAGEDQQEVKEGEHITMDSNVLREFLSECKESRKTMNQQMALISGLVQGITGLDLGQGVMAAAGNAPVAGAGKGGPGVPVPLIAEEDPVVTGDEGRT